MDLYEMISLEDREKIDYYINSNVGSHAPLDILLAEWMAEKETLCQLLGNNLMISKPIEELKTEEELVSDFEKAFRRFYYDDTKFIDSFNKWTYETFPWGKDLIYTDPTGLVEPKEAVGTIPHLILYKNLIINRYEGDTPITLHFPSGHDYRITRGTKIMKILARIAKEYDLTGFEDFRLKHSQLLNEKTIKGDMYLSIHPLDFMTMSDNDLGWSSCMNWRNEGEYRRGTVEMMNSPMVIEAYIPSNSEEMLLGDGMKWNNKRWRELFIVNSNGIVGIKGYPYWNRGLEKIALDWIKELAEKNLGWKYHSELIYLKNGKVYYNDGQDLSYIRLRFHTDAMYNDVRYDHYLYLNQKVWENQNDVEFWYSGRSTCMECGAIDAVYECEDRLRCDDCDPGIYCANCGERLSPGWAIWINDDPYCDYCAEYFSSCESCGDSYEEDSLYELYLADAEKGILYNSLRLICEDCLNSSEYFTKVRVGKTDFDTNFFYVDINNLTEAGREGLFHTQGIEEWGQRVTWSYSFDDSDLKK